MIDSTQRAIYSWYRSHGYTAFDQYLRFIQLCADHDAYWKAVRHGQPEYWDRVR